MLKCRTAKFETALFRDKRLVLFRMWYSTYSLRQKRYFKRFESYSYVESVSVTDVAGVVEPSV